MSIVAQAPRGGLREVLAGQARPMVLTGSEIERFEDGHRGLFDLFDAHYGESGSSLKRITVREARDLVTLGLIGGGMADTAADKLVSGLAPSENMILRSIALGLIGVAFAPDFAEDESAPDPESDSEKKNVSPAGPGTSDA